MRGRWAVVLLAASSLIVTAIAFYSTQAIQEVRSELYGAIGFKPGAPATTPSRRGATCMQLALDILDFESGGARGDYGTFRLRKTLVDWTLSIVVGGDECGQYDAFSRANRDEVLRAMRARRKQKIRGHFMHSPAIPSSSDMRHAASGKSPVDFSCGDALL